MAKMTPEDHLREVVEAHAGAADPRLAEIMRTVVTHLHALVTELRITHEEWLAAITFLTETGKQCDDVRQEYILLSDTLGVSMLLEMINHRATGAATEPTVFGPFHVDGAPRRTMGATIVDRRVDGDEPLRCSGRVLDEGGSPIRGATLDVWQVQSNGLYDVQEGPRERNLRGVFETGADGRYEFHTVRPVDYTIPDDGPVGRMLRATGRRPWRPAHIHFVVAAPGLLPVTTHLFDARSPHLRSDAVFGVRESLVVSMEGGACTYDFVLGRAGA